MDESTEEKTKKEEPKEPISKPEKGSEPKASTLVDEANSAAERMEKANERKTELLKQEEELMVKKTLRGVTEAGAAPLEKKEKTPAEYTKEVMAGELNG